MLYRFHECPDLAWHGKENDKLEANNLSQQQFMHVPVCWSQSEFGWGFHISKHCLYLPMWLLVLLWPASWLYLQQQQQNCILTTCQDISSKTTIWHYSATLLEDPYRIFFDMKYSDTENVFHVWHVWLSKWDMHINKWKEMQMHTGTLVGRQILEILKSSHSRHQRSKKESGICQDSSCDIERWSISTL